MKQTASKTLEKRLERKKTELHTAMKSRQQIEDKIRGLREDIDNLQSTQMEQVFQQVKKTILKEGLRVDAEVIPNILQMLRDYQDSKMEATSEPIAETVPKDNTEIETDMKNNELADIDENTETTDTDNTDDTEEINEADEFLP